MAIPMWMQIASSAAGTGTGIGAPIFSGFMNQAEAGRTRKWNEQMYWQQEEREEAKWRMQNDRDDMVWDKQNAYNERIWQMMNDYNSPMSQMTRFKEAGLNPNLIYGQSNEAGSIATANYGRSPQGRGSLGASPTPHWDTPEWRDPLASIYQFQESAARTNNLEAQSQVAEQEKWLKQAEIQSKKTANEKDSFMLDVIKATSLDAANLDNEKKRAEINRTNIGTNIDLSRNEREAAQSATSLQEAAERILNLRGQRMTIDLENQLKSMDIQLKAMGIQPTDNMFIRMLGRWLNLDNGENKEFMKNLITAPLR